MSTAQTKAPMTKGLKVALWIAGIIVAIFALIIGIGVANMPAGTQNAQADKPTTEPTAQAASDADKQAWADKQYDRWLGFMGVESTTEILADNSANINGYLNSASAFTVGDLLLSAQVAESDTSKEELTKAATAILSTLGYDDENIDTVQIVTADQNLHVIVRRDQVPLLNK